MSAVFLETLDSTGVGTSNPIMYNKKMPDGSRWVSTIYGNLYSSVDGSMPVTFRLNTGAGPTTRVAASLLAAGTTLTSILYLNAVGEIWRYYPSTMSQITITNLMPGEKVVGVADRPVPSGAHPDAGLHVFWTNAGRIGTVSLTGSTTTTVKNVPQYRWGIHNMEDSYYGSTDYRPASHSCHVLGEDNIVIPLLGFVPSAEVDDLSTSPVFTLSGNVGLDNDLGDYPWAVEYEETLTSPAPAKYAHASLKVDATHVVNVIGGQDSGGGDAYLVCFNPATQLIVGTPRDVIINEGMTESGQDKPRHSLCLGFTAGEVYYACGVTQLKSTDYGETWTPTTDIPQDLAGSDPANILYLGRSSTHMVAVTYQRMSSPDRLIVHRSTDGTTWTSSASFLAGTTAFNNPADVFVTVADSASDASKLAIMVCCTSGTATTKIYTTLDHGVTKVTSSANLYSTMSMFSNSVAPGADLGYVGGTFFLVIEAGLRVVKSTDGITWSEVTLSGLLENFAYPSFFVCDGAKMFVGTYGDYADPNDPAPGKAAETLYTTTDFVNFTAVGDFAIPQVGRIVRIRETADRLYCIATRGRINEFMGDVNPSILCTVSVDDETGCAPLLFSRRLIPDVCEGAGGEAVTFDREGYVYTEGVTPDVWSRSDEVLPSVSSSMVRLHIVYDSDNEIFVVVGDSEVGTIWVNADSTLAAPWTEVDASAVLSGANGFADTVEVG